MKFETTLKMYYIFTLNLCLVKNDYITVKTLTFSLQDEFLFFLFFYGIQQQDQAEKFEYLLEESLLLLYKR